MKRKVNPEKAIVVGISAGTYFDGLDGFFEQFREMDMIWGYKINMTLGLSGIDRVVKDIRQAHPGAKVMFDGKFDGTCHDVNGFMVKMKREGIDFVTLHGTSGRFPLETAINAGPTPQVLLSGVSNLSTSEDCFGVYGTSSPEVVSDRITRRAIELCADGVITLAQYLDPFKVTPETSRPFMVVAEGVIPLCTGVVPKDGLAEGLVRPTRVIRSGATHIVLDALLLRTRDGAPRRRAIIEATVEEIHHGMISA